MRATITTLILAGLLFAPSSAGQAADLRPLLDAPLLFVKRHSYTGIHIYDTFYKWPPGGGGICVLENPSAPREQWKIRPIIDPTTPGTLGVGVYTHPELSWDAKKLLFCFKGKPEGNTSIYEIGLDGQGLRRVTDPGPSCAAYKGRLGGQHDIAPAYLPDGRIVFLSTRPSGLVPCNNTGVAILHVMNADGSDMHPISVNNVNEFDPVVLPDGRLLFGRWEYVDKNALTIQSLWTMNPDGTQETAYYANNMVLPEAILDARPVPGTSLVVGTLAKHNATPRGSIGFIDVRLGKNNPRAITNLEHPDDPTYDRGDSCEPWPLSADAVIFSGRPAGAKRNVLELLDRAGHRSVFMEDPDICLHSPMLVKPRPRPPVIPESTDRKAKTGRLFVQDVYQGLDPVKRGEIKWLRIIEETSRVSASTMGGSPYNQTFLVSAALAFSVKNFLGVVPVAEDGSAYFEVPAGRALYLQALDADGRLVQSMRTFVQAAPGTTRSCIGCHEHKNSTPPNDTAFRAILARAPGRPQPESWGSGYLDYPGMVQPILDRHCVECHGGRKDIAAGLDLTGGWTEHFNISYENLVSRRESQLVASLIAGIDCMNGTAHWSCQIFPPRSHGSGAAPLAKLLMDGHQGWIPHLTRTERDLLMAWIDSNGLYHGNWDSTESGCAIKDWKSTVAALTAEMESAGCLKCHGDTKGKALVFESDWFNLQQPELSRILRAPLARGAPGYGLGFCRERKVDPQRQRVRLLVKGYAHAVKPVAEFERREFVPPDRSGTPVLSFASTDDAHYQAMLRIIRQARAEALAAPRVDMPGADIQPGEIRLFVAPPLPATLPVLRTQVEPDGAVRLSWSEGADLIGLSFDLHRSTRPNFQPDDATRISTTTLFQHLDGKTAPGWQHYALLLNTPSGQCSAPVRASVLVPPPQPPPAPARVQATARPGQVWLAWDAPEGLLFDVYRAPAGSNEFAKLNTEPVRIPFFADTEPRAGESHRYCVRAINRRGLASEDSGAIVAIALPPPPGPVFVAALRENAGALLLEGRPLNGSLQGGARFADGSLDLRQGGHASFEHRAEFDLDQAFTLQCAVYFEEAGAMPVIVSSGQWRGTGWFLQRIGNHWRWHVGGVDCDGGKPAVGKWIHLVASFDGRFAKLYQDGEAVASVPCRPDRRPWTGPLLIGQYSPGPNASYQVKGRIKDVKIYKRALTAEEAGPGGRVANKRP